MTVAVKGGTLIDGKADRPAPNVAVVVEGDQISALRAEDSRGDQVDSGAEVIDATGKWVLPGLINMHVHFMMGQMLGRPKHIVQAANPNALAFFATRNALGYLARGWTTVRDMGGPHRIPTHFRDLIAQGVLPGPRVFACGQQIAVTGGHASYLSHEADGADAVRRAARVQLKDGADFVKVNASHDPEPMPGEEQTRPEMSYEEIEAAFDVARAHGKRTACHCMGSIALKRVIDAGVDVISHGCYLNDVLAAQMAEKGVFLDPTLSAYGRQTMNPKLQRGEDWAERHRLLVKPLEASFRSAVKNKVRIVTGTDTAGRYAEDVEMMRELGLDAMESIRACTKNAADALGVGDKLGTIEVGKTADIVVLGGDPLSDPYNLEKVELVIKEGIVYRQSDITLRCEI
ncbi:MAG: amidohydrolase family protein [Propylenella sp.]